MSTLRDAVDNMDENALWALVACAIAVGQSDGRLDANEKNELIQCLRSIGCDRGASIEVINAVLESVDGMAPTEVVDWASEYVPDESVGEACLVVASAIAQKAGGIAAREGVVLQHIANAVGIGYPGNRYMQLLGEGMRLGSS